MINAHDLPFMITYAFKILLLISVEHIRLVH